MRLPAMSTVGTASALNGTISGAPPPAGAISTMSPAPKLRIAFTVPSAAPSCVTAASPTASTFFDLGTLVTNRTNENFYSGGEAGLLSLAFHPNYASNRQFYVFYSVNKRANEASPYFLYQRVSRFTTQAGNPNAADTVEEILIEQRDDYDNHNGGDLHFGPNDGYLYISVGDEGNANDNPTFNSQLINKDLFSGILRIDVDNRGGTVSADMCGSSGISPAEYSIPASNPHVGTSQTCDEIWSAGFRNPWRFSFDRADNRLIIGDVGQGSYEEITVSAAGVGGLDHGWSRCEGRHYDDASGTGTTCPQTTNTVAPVIEYDHSSRCAVSGGFVFRGPVRRMHGTYFYGDSCNSQLWWSESTGATWDSGGEHSLTLGSGNIYGFGEDEDGYVYIVRSNGQIHKLVSEFIFDDDFQQ